MDALLLAFIIFSAQLLVIIGVAAIAEALGRVTDPRVRFTYWRGVAFACLVLPLSAIIGPEARGSGVTFFALSLAGAESVPVAAVLPVPGTVVWWLLCAGALARLGWLCAGAVRLRQLRQRSRAAVLTPDLEAIRFEIAPQAEVRVSCEIAQPAGFGLRHPVVLLPERFFAMDPPAQLTVACHELLHVARRDWSWIVVEEVARALFWFHPAVWWLVERIQESREELVDRLVIARIPSKRAYMAALLAFADGGRWPATLATDISAQAPSSFALADACKGGGHVTKTFRLHGGDAGVCHGRCDCRHRHGLAARLADCRPCGTSAASRGRQGPGCHAAEGYLRGEAAVHTRGNAGQDRGNGDNDCRRPH